MSPHAKLSLGAAVIAGSTLYLAYLGAATSWQYYLVVDECTEECARFVGQRLRVSGRVAANSLQVRDDRTGATFRLAGQHSHLDVSCRGPLPDNLVEDIDVVVEGKLDEGGRLRGDKVMTRCASKYEAAQGGSGGAGRR